jgi:hypothetical protein
MGITGSPVHEPLSNFQWRLRFGFGSWTSIGRLSFTLTTKSCTSGEQDSINFNGVRLHPPPLMDQPRKPLDAGVIAAKTALSV